MTRGLHLQGPDGDGAWSLRIKTETGHTCSILLAPGQDETVRTFIGEENEERQKEYVNLRRLWSYRDRQEAQQEALIAQILSATPEGVPCNVTRIGWDKDQHLSIIRHTIHRGAGEANMATGIVSTSAEDAATKRAS